MAPPSPQLSVLESALIAPSPTPPMPETSLPLTFFDIFWLKFPPVERVFFYRLTPGDDDIPAAVISNLKTSLSRALCAFFPLAGRLRLTPGTAGRYELHYQPGDGVYFTVAKYDVDVHELAVDGPREVAKILPLVPPLPAAEGAVLALQATVLRGGRGLAIGMALHHAACDGASSTLFLHTWAAAAAGASSPPLPVVDRTLVKDPSGVYDIFLRVVADMDEMDYEKLKMSDDQLLATFTLSKEDIRRVKEGVVVAAGVAGATPPRCSSLVATFCFIWSCYQRAKDGDAASSGDPTYFLFPVDHRSRMKPDPFPDEYLGNCIGIALQSAPKAQLAEAGAGGLLTACTAVAAAIEQAVAGGIGSPELWKERAGEAVVSGGGVLSVAGSPRFRVYDIDFGFGLPAKVEIVSVARTGAMAVAESRRNSAGGSMEVGISLPPAAMRRFQKCFDDAIAWLHQQ